jgi:hypothetical protein
MKTTILTIFASALLAGSVAQAASAHEQHRHTARVFRQAPVVADQSYRNSYAAYRPFGAPNYSYDDWQARDEAAMSSGIAGH